MKWGPVCVNLVSLNESLCGTLLYNLCTEFIQTSYMHTLEPRAWGSTIVRIAEREMTGTDHEFRKRLDIQTLKIHIFALSFLSIVGMQSKTGQELH